MFPDDHNARVGRQATLRMRTAAHMITLARRASRLMILCPCACSASPAQNLFGSFFPAWMLCAVIGVLSAISFHQILSVLGISQYIIVPPLTYLSVAVLATLLVWLLWFGH